MPLLLRLSIAGNIQDISGGDNDDQIRLIGAADNAALLDREYEDGIRKIALAIANWNFRGETEMGWPAYVFVLPEK